MNLKLLRTSRTSSGKRSAARAALGFCLVMAPASAQTGRSCAEIEAFMHNANLKVLGAVRALMDNGIMQHAVTLRTRVTAQIVTVTLGRPP